MATKSLDRGGYIQGAVGSSAQNARGQTSGTAFDSETGAVPSAMQYFQSSGRGGGTFRYTRTFLYFDTSGISGANTNLQLIVPGSTNADSNVFVMKSTHGGSNGGELVSGDFDGIDFNTLYNATATGDAWSTSTNTINLNATALGVMNSSDHFNCALIISADYNDTAEPTGGEDGAIDCGVNFGDTIQLSYTAAATPITTPFVGMKSGKYKIISGKIKI
jgi:hypothetical protein